MWHFLKRMCENISEAVLSWAGVAPTSLPTERPICSKHPLISLCQNDQVCFATGPPTQKPTHTHAQSHTITRGAFTTVHTCWCTHKNVYEVTEIQTHTHAYIHTLSLRLPLSLVTAREQGETWALAGEVPRCQLTDIITGAVSKINPPPHFYLLPPVARFPRAPPLQPGPPPCPALCSYPLGLNHYLF